MQTSHRYCTACGTANEPQDAFCFNCGHSLRTTTSMQYPSKKLASSYQTGHLTPNHLLKQRYRILALLDKGGFGAVYKAVDTQLGNRPVAIKEMLQLNPSQQEIEAFKHEAEMLAHLMHPSLPSIHEHFDESGLWYLVMEFVEGKTLQDYVNAKGGWLPIPEVLEIGIQLCTVLNFLHTHQPPIIFRDLKPANIMRTSDGHLYLIDFGIARHFKPGQTKDTTAFGSPGYASPEQYGKAQTTARSDIYSLGATLHQLLTGIDPSQKPFQFVSPQSSGHVIPASLSALIMQMLEMDETRRPASMAAVKQGLEDIKAKLTEKSPLPVYSPMGRRVTSKEPPRSRDLPFPPIRLTPAKTRTLAIITVIVAIVIVLAFSLSPLLHNSAQSSSGPTLNSSSNTPVPAPTATPFPTIAPRPTPTPSPQPGPGTVLCQADASNGWNGWNGTSDWKILNGVLLNDGTNNNSEGPPTIVAPCQLGGIANYAVEANIQVLNNNYPTCFGIDVRGTPTSTTSNGWQGYIGTVYVACNNGNGLLALNADNMNNVNLTSAPFSPGTAFHTYRVEVKDNELRFLVDGAQLLASTDNRYISGEQVGLWSYDAQLNVSSFKIIAL